MRAHSYGDVLSRRKPQIPVVEAETDLVVEDAGSGFCGAVVRIETGRVVLEDRHGKTRVFPMDHPEFLLEGRRVKLTKPKPKTPTQQRKTTASGSVAVASHRARTARASRIWVEGKHDAELVERIWGHDLRVEGVVVEPLNGIDDLAGELTAFGTAANRRVGVLVDHLVSGSKEQRIVDAVHDENVLVTGHPYVDIWQAVKPEAVGIRAWPTIPKGTPWKEGICAELGWGEPFQGWQRILGSVSSFRDVETPLIGAVERLIDFVTAVDG